MGFAECLGVVINMKDDLSREDADYEAWLRQDAEHRCFSQAILRVAPLQAATRFAERPRSYWAKYPGQTGESLRLLTAELLGRRRWREARLAPADNRALFRRRSCNASPALELLQQRLDLLRRLVERALDRHAAQPRCDDGEMGMLAHPLAMLALVHC